MALLLKGAHVVDPACGYDEPAEILIRDGYIVDVARGSDSLERPSKLEIRDLSGCYLIPGMVDVHVHLREPGAEYKEDIESGLRAAAAGGYTGLMPMANTKPVIDNAQGIRFLIAKAAFKPGRTRLYPLGACTKGLLGSSLSEMADMQSSGALAFSDDGVGIKDSGMMRRVMDYAKMLDVPVLSHCQVRDLSGDGVVNEGAVSTRLGLSGWPAAAEEIQILRDIELARLTGCHLHIQHITTAHGAACVALAKKEGLPVSCEVTPHHLFLCEDDIVAQNYNTYLKVNPPLRTKEDCKALQEALIDGTIDMVASDHAPHALHEKALEFQKAPFGTTGLETTLSLLLTHLVLPQKMSWQRLVEVCSIAPRALIHQPQVRIDKGCVADLSIIDPSQSWQVRSDSFVSKAQNSAFIGAKLQGRAVEVYTQGYASLKDGEVMF